MLSRVIMNMTKPEHKVNLRSRSGSVEELGGAGVPTEKDPCTSGVGEIAPGVGHVGHGEHVQLALAAAAGDVDGEENGPCDAAADDAGDDADAQESQEEVAIERVMDQDVGVGQLEQGGKPVEQAAGQGWGALAGGAKSQLVWSFALDAGRWQSRFLRTECADC